MPHYGDSAKLQNCPAITKRAGQLLWFQKVTIGLFGEIDGEITFLASGIVACDEHHLVVVGRFHDGIVDALHVVLRAHG